ncbi:hypothetical protein [Sphingomonas sp. SUN039]|uniref:hypothetical protein n=1 Tax=Sphingomonas sp. SUN039 TaxID=2937787 RepID=UPI0021641E12|nr:hypothetical protein [Sphingomonas sp. SUN039]UVO55542.1 hypothetical protein M0209_15975 [Sphingomonas sp. SUN039]
MQSDHALAEQLMKRRANALFVLSLVFVVTQGSFIGGHATPGPLKLAAWVVLAVVLLTFFASGGGWTRSANVRALMNDESTRAHRARATTIAFYNMMASGIVVYGLGMVKPVSGGEAAHIIMTVGIASALMAFWGLERAAMRSSGGQ